MIICMIICYFKTLQGTLAKVQATPEIPFSTKQEEIEWAVREVKKAFHTKSAVLTLIGKVSQ